MNKIIFFICFIASNISYASTPHIFALHINGINTTRTEARINTYALTNITNINSNMVSFNFVWNPTGDDTGKSFWSNLSDVMNQKAKEHNAAMSLDDFTRYWIKANNLPSYVESSVEFQKLKSQISANYITQLTQSAGVNFNEIINEFHDQVPMEFNDAIKLLKSEYVPKYQAKYYDTVATKDVQTNDFKFDLSGLNKFYQTTTLNIPVNYSDTKNMVLLIPHSQGNLYANSLYTYLTSIEKFPLNQMAIYGIATPANNNLGDWISNKFKWIESIDAKIKIVWGNVDSYITSDNDFVINSSRVLFNQYPTNIILPANFSAGFSSDDFLGHNLINIYLNNTITKTQIGKMIMLELFWMTIGISENKAKYGVSFDTGNVSSTKGSVADNSHVICRYGICDQNVLFFNYADESSQPLLFFTDKYFSGNTYYLLNDTEHVGLSVSLTNPTSITSNIMDCYIPTGGKFGCYLWQESSVRSYADAKISDSFINNWNYVKVLYPNLFINDMFKSVQFTVDAVTQ